MAKKDRKKIDPPPPKAASISWSLSRRGWKVIGAGIVTVMAGFIVLSYTDPRGQNLASHLSPLLIIAGYACIGVGIVLKDPS